MQVRITETHVLEGGYPFVSGLVYDVPQAIRDHLVDQLKVAVDDVPELEDEEPEEKLAAPLANKLKHPFSNKKRGRKR